MFDHRAYVYARVWVPYPKPPSHKKQRKQSAPILQHPFWSRHPNRPSHRPSQRPRMVPRRRVVRNWSPPIWKEVKTGLQIGRRTWRPCCPSFVPPPTATWSDWWQCRKHADANVVGWNDAIIHTAEVSSTVDVPTFRIRAGKNLYDASVLIRLHGYVLISRT